MKRNSHAFLINLLKHKGILYLSAFLLGVLSQNLFIPETPLPVIQVLSSDIEMKTCFTPQQKCLPLIIEEIDQAKNSIKVQCYSFTSHEIAHALLRAHQRGVKIIVIADKSQRKDPYSKVPILYKSGIEVFADDKPNIAHNKLILIDDLTTIGGSYNFTNAAEMRNAENVTIIKNKEWTALFVENFIKRKNVSTN